MSLTITLFATILTVTVSKFRPALAGELGLGQGVWEYGTVGMGGLIFVTKVVRPDCI